MIRPLFILLAGIAPALAPQVPAAPLKIVVVPLTIQEMIADAAKANGIRPEFALRIAWRESRFRPEVTHVNSNYTTDYGVFQLNSCCLTMLGVKHPLDPSENIAAATAYLARLIRETGSEAEADCVYSKGPRRCGW